MYTLLKVLLWNIVIFLPLSRIKDFGLVVCKLVIVIPVHLLGAHWPANGQTPSANWKYNVIDYRLIEGISHTLNNYYSYHTVSSIINAFQKSVKFPFKCSKENTHPLLTKYCIISTCVTLRLLVMVPLRHGSRCITRSIGFMLKLPSCFLLKRHKTKEKICQSYISL